MHLVLKMAQLRIKRNVSFFFLFRTMTRYQAGQLQAKGSFNVLTPETNTAQ